MEGAAEEAAQRPRITRVTIGSHTVYLEITEANVLEITTLPEITSITHRVESVNTSYNSTRFH